MTLRIVISLARLILMNPGRFCGRGLLLQSTLCSTDRHALIGDPFSARIYSFRL